MLEKLDYTICIGSTQTFLYFNLYPYSAYAAHYVYIGTTQRLLHCIYKDVFFSSIYVRVLVYSVSNLNISLSVLPTMFVFIFQKYKTWL